MLSDTKLQSNRTARFGVNRADPGDIVVFRALPKVGCRCYPFAGSRQLYLDRCDLTGSEALAWTLPGVEFIAI